MKKSDFIKIINIIEENNKCCDDLNKLGIQIDDFILWENACVLYEYILEKEYTGEGLDWIFWWLYDYPELKEKEPNKPHVYDKDNNPIKLDSIDDLYYFLEKEYKNTDNE